MPPFKEVSARIMYCCSLIEHHPQTMNIDVCIKAIVASANCLVPNVSKQCGRFMAQEG